MRPVFPTYIIKKKTKNMMKGKFLKAFGITLFPTVVVFLITMAIMGQSPGAKDAFDIILSGDIATIEEMSTELDLFMSNYTLAASLLSGLFAFLNLGSIKLCLDLLRGNEIKFSKMFSLYNRWYIAAIYPFSMAIINFLSIKGGVWLINAGVNKTMVGAITGITDVAIFILSLKLIFVDYILADSNCESFWRAVKESWRMVGLVTVVNYVTLGISFFFWFILIALTGGIAGIYVMPYITLASALLYDMNKQFWTEK